MGLPSFAVVDLETSGLSARRHRILQLGLVVVDSEGAVLDTWSTLVRLRWPLARVGPTEIHGITRGRLRGAPRIDDVLDEFAARVGDSVLTAHNADFDGSFLDAAARRRRTTTTDLGRRLCTLTMSRRLDPDRQHSHRLGDVCARYGVELTTPHDALADAEATAAVLPHLLRAHQVRHVDDLEPFFVRAAQVGATTTSGRSGRQSP